MLVMIHGFISYSNRDRHIAADVKAALASIGVDSFMAHDDIHVSQQWRDRILAELRSMQVFVPLLSKNFRQSDWASQEVGIAIARSDVLIIPTSLDETIPYGFLAAFQSRPLGAFAGPEFFREVIANRFPREAIDRLIDIIAESSGWRAAEHNFDPLVPFLGELTAAEAQKLALASTRNSQVWDAGGCRSRYLPAFLESSRHQLAPEVLRPLEYQLEHGEPYPGDAQT